MKGEDLRLGCNALSTEISEERMIKLINRKKKVSCIIKGKEKVLYYRKKLAGQQK
jgi:hypothetical protein